MVFLMSLLITYGRVNSQMIISKLQLEEVELSQALEKIEKLTEYDFVFSYDDVEGYKVTVDLESRTLEESMEEILKDLPFEYKTEGDVVIVSYKKLEPIIEEQQEKKTLKGKVTDEKGNPLPGVSIIIKNTYVGVSTNIDGEYVMGVLESNVTLVFSSIGFVSQEKLFEGQKELDVKMVPDLENLSEVVVTGYFKQAKESFTGSAVTISSDELLQVGNQNILQSIQLIDPSFMLVDNALEGSNPNAIPDFQIRGAASVDMQGEYGGNPNMPTFILDGFEVDVEKVYDLDSYRVRSVTILKDAAATAIYGSRAANGVVVIETLAPEAGRMAVSYKGDFTFTSADLSDYDLLNANEKLDLEVAAGLYEGANNVQSFESAQERYNEKLKLVKQGFNTYWLNKPIETVAFSHKHSLLLEGGNDEIRYGIDVNYSDQNGIMKESGRDRMGIGLKLQYTYKNLIIRNKLSYDNVKATNSPYGSFSTYAKLNPYYRYENDLGQYEYVLEDIDYYNRIYNPLYNTSLNTIDENKYDGLINNFDIDWRMSDDFRIKGSLSLNKRINTTDVFKPGIHTNYANESDINKKGGYRAVRGESTRWQTNIVLNYFKQIDKHVINANGLFNANQTQTESMTTVAQGFPNEDMDNIDFAIQYEADGKPQGSEYTSRLLGLSGNVNYSFDSRYLADLSYRADASSAFGVKKRWAPFWALGVGWNLHNENVFKDSGLINKLKIRGSYGYTGSVGFNPYQAMMMYNYRTDLIHRFEAGATLMAMGNKNLLWQQTLKRNIGLDFVMFNNCLSGTLNYYNDISENLLVDIDLAPSLGFSQYKENLGESKNEGYELSLRYNVIKNKGGVRWSVYGNAVRNKNTLLKLSDSLEEFNADQDEVVSGNNPTATRPRVRYVEGQSMTAIWANKSLGIDPATGKEMFVTKDGGTTLKWDADNLMVCGDSNPDVFGNFGTNFSYKGFMMNVVFRYRIGGQYYNQTLVSRVENADPTYNTDRRVLDARWENPGDMTFYKDIKDSGYTNPTSRFIQDYSYLELATINASYEFSSTLAEKVGMKRLKMLFYMSDAFRTSTVKTERGINYPFARSFSLGIHARF
jgi:TonB-linked SusC/RagA family outer membrane protein